jgi:sugar-specific transcriptional regulator TrmB
LIENKEKILDRLAELGLSKYEGKAYTTLLQKANISAYKVSKNSTVPQSKIYETVKKLVDKGLVATQGSDPVKYSPLPIDEFLERYKSNMEKSITYLKDNLKGINSHPRVDYMWHFTEKMEILNKAKKMIKKAEKKISIEIWDDQFRILKPLLKEAVENDIEVIIVFYGDIDSKIGDIYYHQMEGMHQAAREVGRWLTINKDGEESLFGIFK